MTARTFGLDNAVDMSRSAVHCGYITEAQGCDFVSFLLDHFRDDDCDSVERMSLHAITEGFNGRWVTL